MNFELALRSARAVGLIVLSAVAAFFAFDEWREREERTPTRAESIQREANGEI
jgi:hypothetical protein